MNLQNTKNQVKMPNQNTKTSNKTSSVNEEFFARRRIQDHFTQIPNAIITYQMSFAAHWLITYLLYHPPFNKDGSKWNPNSEYLIKLFKQRNVGKHTYYNALNELIELGYVLREHIMVGNIRQGIRYEYDFEPVFKEQNNIEKIKSNTKSKKMFPTSQFSASRGEGSIYNTKVQNNTRENNTKESNPTEIPLEYPKLKKPKTKTATAPSSPIIPLFSYSWKNKTTGDFEKIENGITQKEMEKLLEIGLNETEIRQICNEMAAWAERSNGTIRFKNANVYRKILDWKRKKDLKKEEKKQLNKEKEARKEMDYSEREQKNIPDVEGKRQDDFKAYITKVRENPKNSLICNLIRPNGGCTNAELFRINGRTLHSTLNYNEVNYKDKMAAWMKDMTQEFKERDKLKNSWG